MNLRSTFLHLAGRPAQLGGRLDRGRDHLLHGLAAGRPGDQLPHRGDHRLERGAVLPGGGRRAARGVPAHLDFFSVAESLAKVPGVTAVHDLHVWTITSGLLGAALSATWW